MAFTTLIAMFAASAVVVMSGEESTRVISANAYASRCGADVSDVSVSFLFLLSASASVLAPPFTSPASASAAFSASTSSNHTVNCPKMWSQQSPLAVAPLPPPHVATHVRIIRDSCSSTAFSASTSPASPSCAKISARVDFVTCSINAPVERGVYPSAFASTFATATFALSLSPTKATLTPFISPTTVSHAALSAFVASAEAGASAAARATGVERFGTEDARKRLWETPARADEQHPTAERRDICRGGRRRE
eukprot:CAMPEP_0197123628 /NCGR_PEP_ID=MMETSP1390-20130617/6692_1 /TAXON_ID=38833 /ORGANISM="Micromonas sp., Strain CCMP2099" /LENGTH=251 /DNA_ID=CAMNT_0042565691 /DNA_START=190 /DNA_END=942 /DNA_ORIENTATION=+